MNRFLIARGIVRVASSSLLAIGMLALVGCDSPEVGSVKPPQVKDKSEILPGFDPNAKSPYSAGAAKKKSKSVADPDKALPPNSPSL